MRDRKFFSKISLSITIKCFFRLDCVGILKICSYDAKQRKRFHGSAGSQHSAVRIAFRAYIPHEGQANTFTVLETQTETIRCGKIIYIIVFQ